MSKSIAVRWSKTEMDAIVDAIRSLLRGFNLPTDAEHVGDYLSLLRGLRPEHCLDGIERVRAAGTPPNPGVVRQAALEPAPSPPRLAKCPTCRYHLTACICDATGEDRSEEIAALEAQLAKVLGR